MKRTIFHCAGNTVLFTLFGLAFLFPFSETHRVPGGFGASVSVFPLLLLVYLAAYPLLYFIVAKKSGWQRRNASELCHADEREQAIVGASTKTAYTVLVGGLLVCIAALGGVQFFILMTQIQIDLYRLSIALATALLDIATLCYCVRWCREYQK